MLGRPQSSESKSSRAVVTTPSMEEKELKFHLPTDLIHHLASFSPATFAAAAHEFGDIRTLLESELKTQCTTHGWTGPVLRGQDKWICPMHPLLRPIPTKGVVPGCCLPETLVKPGDFRTLLELMPPVPSNWMKWERGMRSLKVGLTTLPPGEGVVISSESKNEPGFDELNFQHLPHGLPDEAKASLGNESFDIGHHANVIDWLWEQYLDNKIKTLKGQADDVALFNYERNPKTGLLQATKPQENVRERLHWLLELEEPDDVIIHELLAHPWLNNKRIGLFIPGYQAEKYLIVNVYKRPQILDTLVKKYGWGSQSW